MGQRIEATAANAVLNTLKPIYINDVLCFDQIVKDSEVVQQQPSKLQPKISTLDQVEFNNSLQWEMVAMYIEQW